MQSYSTISGDTRFSMSLIEKGRSESVQVTSDITVLLTSALVYNPSLAAYCLSLSTSMRCKMFSTRQESGDG